MAKLPQSRRLTGKDKFGEIRISTGTCLHCGEVGTLVRWPKGLKIPGIDLKARTLICNITMDEYKKYDPKTGLGINCGHYASFHRQVAHIESAGRHK